MKVQLKCGKVADGVLACEGAFIIDLELGDITNEKLDELIRQFYGEHCHCKAEEGVDDEDEEVTEVPGIRGPNESGAPDGW